MNSHFILVPMGRLMFLGILRIPDVWYPNIHRFNSYSFDFAKVLARLPSIGFSIPFFVHAEDSLSSVFNFVLSTCCTWSPFLSLIFSIDFSLIVSFLEESSRRQSTVVPTTGSVKNFFLAFIPSVILLTRTTSSRFFETYPGHVPF